MQGTDVLLGAITRIAAGKMRGTERGGRRERSPGRAQELYAGEPIGSNIHFSFFSPFAIGGAVRVRRDPHKFEKSGQWRNYPGEDTSLPTLRGERAPRPISG